MRVVVVDNGERWWGVRMAALLARKPRRPTRMQLRERSATQRNSTNVAYPEPDQTSRLGQVECVCVCRRLVSLSPVFDARVPREQGEIDAG